MLSRSHRLDTKQFNEVLNGGKIVHTPLFIAHFKPVSEEKSRLAAVAPLKSFKTAVLRNKTRRQIYEAARPLMSEIKKPVHVVLIAKISITKAKPPDVQADIKSLFVKAGIVR